MCNLLPTRHNKISKTGEGWKVFKKMDSGRYNSLFDAHRYRRDDKGWVTWKNGRGGFCFFIDKEEAERFLEKRNEPNIIDGLISESKGVVEVLKRITYDEGMGSFDSEAMSYWKEKPYHIALCKKFKIMKG